MFFPLEALLTHGYVIINRGGGGQNWLLGGKMNSNFLKDLHSASQTAVQPALQLASYQLPSYLVVGNVLKPLTVTRVNKVTSVPSSR